MRNVEYPRQIRHPGFIALHEHIERSILDGHGTLPNFTTQGFTTAVINADGRTAVWPPPERADLDQAGTGHAAQLDPPASLSLQPPWTLHAPSRTPGGPIEAPIPVRAVCQVVEGLIEAKA